MYADTPVIRGRTAPYPLGDATDRGACAGVLYVQRRLRVGRADAYVAAVVLDQHLAARRGRAYVPVAGHAVVDVADPSAELRRFEARGVVRRARRVADDRESRWGDRRADPDPVVVSDIYPARLYRVGRTREGLARRLHDAVHRDLQPARRVVEGVRAPVERCGEAAVVDVDIAHERHADLRAAGHVRPQAEPHGVAAVRRLTGVDELALVGESRRLSRCSEREAGAAQYCRRNQGVRIMGRTPPPTGGSRPASPASRRARAAPRSPRALPRFRRAVHPARPSTP